MKCKFNSKLMCGFQDCLNCVFKKNLQLDNYLELNVQKIIKEESTFRICPFCLHIDNKLKFYQETSKFMKCPNCENIFHIETLDRIYKMNAKQLAEFVFKYPFWEYWKKCKFQDFKKGLQHFDMFDFWDYYNKWRNKNEKNN